MEQIKEMLRNATSKYLSNDAMTYKELYDVFFELKKALNSPHVDEILGSLDTNSDEHSELLSEIYQAIETLVNKNNKIRKRLTKKLIGGLFNLTERLEKINKKLICGKMIGRTA